MKASDTAVLTHYFDAAVYSKDFVVDYMVSGSGRGVRHCDTSTKEGTRAEAMTDFEYVSSQVDCGDLHEFFFDYYSELVKNGKLRDFKVISESVEVRCPDGLAELIVRTAAGEGSVCVRHSGCLEVEDRCFNLVKDVCWKKGKTPGCANYNGPITSLSRNHLASKIGFGGYDYWVTAGWFFTSLLISRGLIDRSAISDHVSIGGWVLEQIQPDAL